MQAEDMKRQVNRQDAKNAKAEEEKREPQMNTDQKSK
jgi:hypothetical protein